MSRDLSPREARDRFLSRRRQENTEKTVRSYENRLTRFVEWTEDQQIDSMSELSGWDIDEYRSAREASGVAPATLRGQLMALKQLLDYCASIDVVDHRVPEKVNIPTLSKSEESNDTKLEVDDADALLTFYRSSGEMFGRPEHAFLEVAWHTGARMSGIRALDMGDFDPDRQTLEFRHRPPTRLKNKEEGERVVGISKPVVKALRTYVARERFEKRDEEGREPLFSGRQGRPSDTTFRAWSYLGTQPCRVVQCPHGNRRATCDYTRRNHASKCPSSRSPHAIRTGSITWQLLQGLSIDVVAARVNATPKTIRRHYYRAAERDEFEELRAEHTLKLDIENYD
ncbi:tyrosine-type recombinase/integrase [Natrarchaeobaculum sulfurireducens]|uniref:XerD/XerC family integrase n=1 Tax=Natrarchaeobaculum sulfurireducens TaxID=2044521 RepID=A0A346PDW5_9EURY|nr:tyrosine-type recombinase/integrase [Natrarchaeobaculum sulfurireducens]AXR77710.1 XerD/XerC family integrase [Natrarchaeobaculum sulfurireducens]